jgi:protein-disulfide isomerase-like protein with CxxC motif
MEVTEFTDPACSWAWGTEPKLRLLQWRYGNRVEWRQVLGGLIGDMNNQVDGEYDPIRFAERYVNYWEMVFNITGQTYPVELKWMYWSTEPAGKAVKAAAQQSDDLGAKVLRRFREATFIFGEPPDNTERILKAVRGLAGLDHERFAADLTSEIAEKTFREDWEETRRPNDYVMNLEGDWPGIGKAKHSEGHWRFVFPTVIFRGDDGEATVPGWCPMEDYLAGMESAQKGSTSDPRPDPTPQQLFETWPTATSNELKILCGEDAQPPDGVVAFDWGAGTFYVVRDEAEALQIA